MKDTIVKTAFILGAGLGTRLLPLTEKMPKPLLPIGGRPVITYAFDHLLALQVRRFIINTHHLAHRYSEVFPGCNWRGIPLIFRHESHLLDTGGGLKNIESLLNDEEDLIVYNGDVISNLPLIELVATHRSRNFLVTLALRSKGDPLSVVTNEKREVVGFYRMPGAGEQVFLFTGIYMVSREFFSYLKDGVPLSVITYFQEILLQKPGSLGGAVIDEGYWYDIGTPEKYYRVKELFEK